MRDLEKPGRSPAHRQKWHGCYLACDFRRRSVSISSAAAEMPWMQPLPLVPCSVWLNLSRPVSAGDNFCIYAPGGSIKDMIAFNGSGRAPMAATLDWYRDNGITSLERQTPACRDRAGRD